MSEVQGGFAAAGQFRARVQAGIAARLDAGPLDVMQLPGKDSCGLRVSGAGMMCEMTVRKDGLRADWGAVPAPGHAPPAELAARVTAGIAGILHAPGNVPPGSIAWESFPLYTVAGQVLREAGLDVRMRLRLNRDDLEVIVSLLVSNPGVPDAGKVTLHDDGSLEWQWRFPPGSAPQDIAGRAAAAVLGLIPAPQLVA
jgi:hypothetical protein